jgi:hypothetical protein
MSSDPTPRKCFKQIPGGQASNIDNSGDPSVADVIGEGWEWVIPASGMVGSLVWRGYIDVSGWSSENLTWFTQRVDIQEQNVLLGTQDIDSVWVFDILSTERVNDQMCSITAIPGFMEAFPGAGGAGLEIMDLQHVIFGQRTQWNQDSTIAGVYMPTSSDTFGSGNPSAKDKLHLTRIVWAAVGGTPGTQTIISYPVNYVLDGFTVKEPDLVYLERLRRSYILQG